MHQSPSAISSLKKKNICVLFIFHSIHYVLNEMHFHGRLFSSNDKRGGIFLETSELFQNKSTRTRTVHHVWVRPGLLRPGSTRFWTEMPPPRTRKHRNSSSCSARQEIPAWQEIKWTRCSRKLRPGSYTTAPLRGSEVAGRTANVTWVKNTSWSRKDTFIICFRFVFSWMCISGAGPSGTGAGPPGARGSQGPGSGTRSRG